MVSKFLQTDLRQGLMYKNMWVFLIVAIVAILTLLSHVTGMQTKLSEQPFTNAPSINTSKHTIQLNANTSIQTESADAAAPNQSAGSSAASTPAGITTQVEVNGQKIPVPQNGSVSKTIVQDNGTTSITIDSQTNSSSNTSGSSSRTNLNVQSSSSSSEFNNSDSTHVTEGR